MQRGQINSASARGGHHEKDERMRYLNFKPGRNFLIKKEHVCRPGQNRVCERGEFSSDAGNRGMDRLNSGDVLTDSFSTH